MKVCLVTDNLPPNCGGAPLITLNLAQELRTAEGVKTQLIAWDRNGDGIASTSLPAYVHSVRLNPQHQAGMNGLMEPAKLLMHIAELGARLGALMFSLRREFDVLHISNAASLFSLMTIPWAKLLNKPVIIEMVLLDSDDPVALRDRSRNQAGQLFPHRPLKYSLFLQADAYVAISPGLGQAYLKAGLPEAKLFQIPYGVETERFKPPTPDEKRSLRQKLELNSEEIVILFVGLINERKGVHRLLDAFRNIASSHPKARLLIVGPSLPPDATYLSAIHETINSSGLHERVTLVDEMVENVHEYMRASDIFCLPTNREGFGMVIIEAMASGLPVVTSRLDGVTTEIIRSDREGVLVPVGDTTALALALSELVRDAALRFKVGQAARKRVQRDFMLGTYSRRWVGLYETVLN